MLQSGLSLLITFYLLFLNLHAKTHMATIEDQKNPETRVSFPVRNSFREKNFEPSADKREEKTYSESVEKKSLKEGMTKGQQARRLTG